MAFGAACPIILLCLCHCHLVHASYHFTSVMLGFTTQFETHFHCHFHPLNLSHPATFTSSQETGSLLARAPLDCRAAAVCEQAAIASKRRTHQVLRLLAWQREDTYQTPYEGTYHAFTMSSAEPVGELLLPQYA